MPKPFSLHRRGDFTPAACARCGQSENLIDLGCDDIQFYGRLYFCIQCEAELAQQLGYVDPDANRAQVAHFESEAKHWKTQHAAAVAGAQTITATIADKTKELGNGIRKLADDFADSIFDTAVRGSAAVPLPASDEEFEPPIAGAGNISAADDGGLHEARAQLERQFGLPDGHNDKVSRGQLGENAGGVAEDAGVGAEVDGPDFDAIFGWDSEGADDDVDASDEHDSDARN